MFETVDSWNWGSGAPEGGFQGLTLMDRAWASCEFQMANNGLEDTEDYCCQVRVYIGTWETATASTWQDGEFVAVADVVAVTETQWNPFVVLVEGEQSYVGAVTKTQYYYVEPETDVVEPEDGAGATLATSLATIAASFNFLI